MLFSLIGFALALQNFHVNARLPTKTSILLIPYTPPPLKTSVTCLLEVPISQLEEQFESIARERESIVAEIEVETQNRLAWSEAVRLREEAAWFKEKTRDEYPDVKSPSVSPLETLNRYAIIEIKKGPFAGTKLLTEKWYKWYRESHPELPFDTRSKAEMLHSYVRARKVGLIPPTSEIEEFEEMLASLIRDGRARDSFV